MYRVPVIVLTEALLLTEVFTPLTEFLRRLLVARVAGMFVAKSSRVALLTRSFRQLFCFARTTPTKVSRFSIERV